MPRKTISSLENQIRLLTEHLERQRCTISRLQVEEIENKKVYEQIYNEVESLKEENYNLRAMLMNLQIKYIKLLEEKNVRP